MLGRKVKYTEFPEWFISELVNDKDKEEAKLGYLPHSKVVDFYCEKHGIYTQRVSNHISFKTYTKVSGCPECGKSKKSKLKTETQNKKRSSYPEWFINELAYKEDKEKALNRTLVSSDKVYFICPEHGEYKQIVYNHIRLSTGERIKGCPICAKIKRAASTIECRKDNRPSYPDWFIDELVDEEDKKRALNKTLTYKDKVSLLCKEHGIYKQTVSDHLDYKTGCKKQGCPKCGRIKQSKSKIEKNKQKRIYPDWFIDDLANEEDKKRALSKELIWSDKVDFICSKHGIYRQRVDAHIHLTTGKPNQGCPSCGISISYNEKEIYDFIKSLDSSTEKRNRSIIKECDSDRFLELDIYIPDKKIAIEYNGSYWHSDRYRKDKKFHLKKYQLCLEQGIRLISIFDKDWKANRDKILLFLKDLILPTKKIYGRNTDIRKISYKEARDFLDLYHLKGGGDSFSLAYGLFYDNQIISCMSFSKPKFGNQKNIEWDLSRYCVKPGYSVIGGAEKLFTAFIKENNPTSIVTYSDNDYFSGDVYPKLGFSFVKYTDLPYYWAKSDRFFLERQQCQVKKLKEKYPELYKESLDMQVSNKEDFIMHKLGYYKVYRCGNKKWLWTKDSK